ncbi:MULTISPECIES: hypothetical protein [unclassified Pseudomonas]|uniref:hypothetical protein n=1 Tax=unclassified Pseudomonas TaxID=196821 RepID=UPI000C2FF2AB|nr:MULTISPECIES: hypothetical protein [unclassified Pseudomonas]MCU1736240.1 hypothetical protein [Pseudomonas sp. 20S_6.2_Bac1]
MKLTLRGWGREMTQHHHTLKPVANEAKGYRPLSSGPVFWHDALSAYGKIEKASLSGSFLVEMKFEQTELENWLTQFSRERPAEALRIIAKAQAEAIIALHGSAEPPDNDKK